MPNSQFGKVTVCEVKQSCVPNAINMDLVECSTIYFQQYWSIVVRFASLIVFVYFFCDSFKKSYNHFLYNFDS